MQTLKHKNLIVSIPKEIKNKIDAEFGSEYSTAGLEKIYFLYFKINKENNNYQVNSTNHTWFFGFKNRGELAQILDRLRNKIFVIKLTSEYSIGYKSNSYSVIKPYDYKNENCHIIRFYDGQVKFPNWVQKYVADGGIVKNVETTNWIKTPNKKSLNTESLKDIEIKGLRAEIERLNNLLSNDNTSAIEVLTLPVAASNKVVFTPLSNNKFSKNSIQVTLDHEAVLHDLTPDIKEFEYDNEKYIVTGWNKIKTEYIYSEEDLIEELGDAMTNRIFNISSLQLHKKYDFNKNTNYITLKSA